MPAWVPSRHLLACGPTGCGKTFALRRWAAAWPRLVYVAPTLDPASWPTTPADRIVREDEQDGAYQLFAQACERRERARFVVEATAGADYAADVAAWAALVLECGDAVLIVDELEEVLEHGAPDELRRLLLRGRKAGAWVWAAAHRPLAVPRAFTANADVVAWRTAEPLDCAWYDKAGIPSASVLALPAYHAVVRTAEGRVLLLAPGGAVADVPA